MQSILHLRVIFCLCLSYLALGRNRKRSRGCRGPGHKHLLGRSRASLGLGVIESWGPSWPNGTPKQRDAAWDNVVMGRELGHRGPVALMLLLTWENGFCASTPAPGVSVSCSITPWPKPHSPSSRPAPLGSEVQAMGSASPSTSTTAGNHAETRAELGNFGVL